MSEATWEEPSDLIIEQIEIGPMQNYTYLIGCRSTREVVLVDPAWDIDSLVNHINEKDYKLTAALAAHCIPTTSAVLSAAIRWRATQSCWRPTR